MQHILVVDDDDDIRFLMRVALTNAGYHVTEAENGAVAMHMLEADSGIPIELVVADVSMPLMGGLELTNRVRARLLGRRLPILIVSALSSRAAVRNALAAGADDFLSKPFAVSQLIARVDRLLGVEPDDEDPSTRLAEA